MAAPRFQPYRPAWNTQAKVTGNKFSPRNPGSIYITPKVPGMDPPIRESGLSGSIYDPARRQHESRAVRFGPTGLGRNLGDPGFGYNIGAPVSGTMPPPVVGAPNTGTVRDFVPQAPSPAKGEAAPPSPAPEREITDLHGRVGYMEPPRSNKAPTSIYADAARRPNFRPAPQDLSSPEFQVGGAPQVAQNSGGTAAQSPGETYEAYLRRLRKMRQTASGMAGRSPRETQDYSDPRYSIG